MTARLDSPAGEDGLESDALRADMKGERASMNRITSIGAGVVLAVVLTHGMVKCALNLADEAPAWTYIGFFQRSLFNLDVVWARVHGWPSERDCETATRQARVAEMRAPLVNVAVDSMDPATGEPQTSTRRGKRPQDVAADRARMQAANTVCGATHIDQFGRFYAHTVELICPAMGFALFWMLARRKVAALLWRPLAMVTVAALLPVGRLGLVEPWFEVARTLVVITAMMWSVGAFQSGAAAEIPMSVS